MAIINYSTLKSTIADYLARDDLTNQIPTFIQLAENRLRRDLKLRSMLKVVTTTTTAGDSTVAYPSDFLAMKDIHINTGSTVESLIYQNASNFFRNTKAATSGMPKNYTSLATEFQFAPIPDGVYTLNMIYYSKPAFLSDTNPSNAFMADAPDLLLYAALGEAEPYLMNDDRLNTWASLYQRGLESLRESDDSSNYPASPMVISVSTR